VLLVGLACGCVVSGCGGSTTVIDLNKKTSQPRGIQGQIVKLSGTTATVRGQLLHGQQGVASGPAVTRDVKLWPDAVQGMHVGDHVYFGTSPAGGFAQDKARDQRNHACLVAITAGSKFAQDAQTVLMTPTADNAATFNADVGALSQAMTALEPKASATQLTQLQGAVRALGTLTIGGDVSSGAQVVGIALGASPLKDLPTLLDAICP